MNSGSARTHLVQFYDEDRLLVESAARFGGDGLRAGETLIAIATPEHRSGLEAALTAQGLDVASARAAGRYLTFDAAETLATIMRGERPDREAFAEALGERLWRAVGNASRTLRIFGEMVTLLWERGECDAALQLEKLWNELSSDLPIALLCGYSLGPLVSEASSRAFLRICAAHTHVTFPNGPALPSRGAERHRGALVLREAWEPPEHPVSAASRLSAILGSSDDAIVDETLDGVVTSWNRGAERIFGFSAEEMIGDPISRIVPGERHEELSMLLGAVRGGVRVERYETERVRKDDRRILVSLSLAPIREAGGEVVGIAEIARDVTERWLVDAQCEQLVGIAQRVHAKLEAERRVRQEILATLSHELRNPLAATRNALESAELAPDLRDRALAIARRQSRQLGRLVDDLLDMAQIAHGGVRLDLETIALRELVERAVETTRLLREDGGHTLAISLPREEVRLDCDPLRLEQALVNLLCNAVKFTPRGGHVEIRGERENDGVAILVRDDGIGIAPELIDRIFDPFVQAPQELDRARGGLGVGLTVARGFVSLHGGTIEARSGGLGAGAEFVVRLPAEAGPARRAVAISEGPKRGIRILVAEDDRDVAESMELLLRAYGHRVQLVVDGPSALEAARAEAPTLMIVDIGLPGMDGYEVARGVRQSLGLRDTVLIALTGYGQEQDRRRAREAGFDHHLTKPVDPSVLRSLIADIPSRPSDR